jgi:hypothetical protein
MLYNFKFLSLGDFGSWRKADSGTLRWLGFLSSHASAYSLSAFNICNETPPDLPYGQPINGPVRDKSRPFFNQIKEFLNSQGYKSEATHCINQLKVDDVQKHT